MKSMWKGTGQVKQSTNQYAFESPGMGNWVSIACLLVSHITDLCLDHKTLLQCFQFLGPSKLCSSPLWNSAIPMVINVILTYLKFVIHLLPSLQFYRKVHFTWSAFKLLQEWLCWPKSLDKHGTQSCLYGYEMIPIPRHGLCTSPRHVPFCSFI